MIFSEKEFTGFFKPDWRNGYLSNWYYVTFNEDGIEFSSSEQYMMYKKAILFGDREVAAKILKTTDNALIKKLGRQVRNFDEITWVRECENIMFNGLYAKFSQNKELKNKLLVTGNNMIAECSPYDKIWGIGLSISDMNRFDTDKWKGMNKLGKSLMAVRDRLRQEEF